MTAVLAEKCIRVSSSCPRVCMLELAENWRGVHGAHRETGYHRWNGDVMG